jgi:hypothetical protein
MVLYVFMPPRFRKKLVRPVKLSDLIDNRTRRWRLQRLKRLEIIRAKWPQAAGEYVAGHTQPVRLVRTTLRVAVDDAGWLSEMTYLTDAILERLRELLPGNWVDEIKAVTGEALPASSDMPRNLRPRLSEPTAEMQKRLDEALPDLEDRDLAEVIRRTMLTSLRLDGRRLDAVEKEANKSTDEEQS